MKKTYENPMFQVVNINTNDTIATSLGYNNAFNGDNTKILGADRFRDFEDCLQTECALATNAEYIVTRNKKDFANSPIVTVQP